MGAEVGGIKVHCHTRVVAGTWGTVTVGDSGAEKWKIEQPGTSDDTRGLMQTSV